jgi:hypothetical protein
MCNHQPAGPYLRAGIALVVLLAVQAERRQIAEPPTAVAAAGAELARGVAAAAAAFQPMGQ